MRKIFVEDVRNVKHFKSLVDRLIASPDGVPLMSLVFSEPGFGKTRTLAWYVAHRPGVVVRAKALMNGRWLLSELVRELGEAPMHYTRDLFEQAVSLLMDRRCPVFIDEVDHLCHDSRVVETLRDLHDMCHVPVVLVGMGMADKKLMRHRHLFDRLKSAVLRFQPLTREDVKAALKKLCEVDHTDDCVDLVAERAEGKFRLLIYEVLKMERLARASNIRKITAAELRK